MDKYFDEYKILIDGRWSLEDLYQFPRAYEQVYFAIEAMLPAADEEAEYRMQRAFLAYPWQGGYSSVNFYNSLKHATPAFERPAIVSLKYASPGWIELHLNLPLAIQVAGAITTVAGSIGACNKVYNAIYTNLQQRKLLKIEVERKQIELTREQLSIVRHSFDELSAMIGVEHIQTINARTDDPLISLKILLSIYRRLRDLAEYQNSGMAEFRGPKIPPNSFDDLRL